MIVEFGYMFGGGADHKLPSMEVVEKVGLKAYALLVKAKRA